MRQCETCGAMVAGIRMQGRGEAEVHLFPLPYRESAGAGREYITAYGRRVNGASCFPEEKSGTGYLEHKHPEGKA